MPSDRALLDRQMADVEIRPFTLDEFHRRRQQKQRTRRIATAVMSVVLAAVAIGGILGTVDSDSDQKTITSNVPGPNLPTPSPFVGSWESTDTDGSHQTMAIQPSGTGAYEMVIFDDATTACAGVPGTLTGIGQLETDGRLVVAAEFTCDDGSTPVPMSDPETAGEFQETLANLWFVHDPVTDELVDSLGVLWRHPGAPQDPGTEESALEGRWMTEAVPLEQIRASMLQAGVTEEEIDTLFFERAMTTDYTFSLEFRGDDFSYGYEQTTEPSPSSSPRDTGTFVHTGDRLFLFFAGTQSTAGGTVELSVELSGNDRLTLRFVGSAQELTPADVARAADVRAIAYYTSAPFLRQP